MAEGEVQKNEVQRWTAKRRAALVLQILKGKTSVTEAARTHGLTVAEVERWKDRFLAGAENALRSRPRDEEAQKEALIQRLERKVGRMALEIDIMQEAMKPYRPFDDTTSSE
jgi:transposase-like protein